MSIEKEQSPNNPEKERLAQLAEELDAIQAKKTGGEGDAVMQKLIKRLRAGDARSARVFLGNEADKFSQYREDAVPLIIERLYGGSGSPWFSVEREMKAARPDEEPESGTSMEKRERTFFSAEERANARFQEAIAGRRALWKSIVEESRLTAGRKGAFYKILDAPFSPQKHGNIGAFLDSLEAELYEAVLHSDQAGEAYSIYENLAADITAFERELYAG